MRPLAHQARPPAIPALHLHGSLRPQVGPQNILQAPCRADVHCQRCLRPGHLGFRVEGLHRRHGWPSSGRGREQRALCGSSRKVLRTGPAPSVLTGHLHWAEARLLPADWLRRTLVSRGSAHLSQLRRHCATEKLVLWQSALRILRFRYGRSTLSPIRDLRPEAQARTSYRSCLRDASASALVWALREAEA